MALHILNTSVRKLSAYARKYPIPYLLLIGIIGILLYYVLREPHLVEPALQSVMPIVSQPSQPSIDPPYQVEPFEMIRVGANDYKVHEDLSNPKLAAETMDNLNSTAHQLIKMLKDKYSSQQGLDSIKPEYRDVVQGGIARLAKNFKTANMEENIPERSGGDTSYVIDKGEVFAMCLRDPKRDNAVDVDGVNELRFVLIHEMAHLFTESFGHDTTFWNNFRFILQEAAIANIYNPTNYKKNAQPYCGIVISYSPLYDGELKEYSTRNPGDRLVQKFRS